MSEQILFALDTGTRNVVGLLCRVDADGQIEIVSNWAESHPHRAMLDGQIHDVAEVGGVIARVKDHLEKQVGINLKKAAIAAAGRALSTLRSRAEITFPTPREIGSTEVHQVEMKALQAAKEEMAANSSNLYCVGFSAVGYTLNDMAIGNPVGQRGRSVGVEIIATFLPREVVDGLFSALSRAGLEVESLTLEPIAAMEVAVPYQFRELNLAMIDIGAGTSDIAISRNGTVFAYGMVDKAGDEVTEAIAQHYLLDFNTAEKVKLQMAEKEEVEFSDVLGNRYCETREKLLRVIEPVVDGLASTLAEAVRANNGGKAPSAVFCVGGGSHTPLLKDYLALHLDIKPERIGIRDLEGLERVIFPSQLRLGPEMVTPLGIALVALRNRGGEFYQVTVNGQKITLFNVQQATVAQALLDSDVAAILDGVGKPKEFFLNGQPRQIEVERRPLVFVNGAEASLDTVLNPGDVIEVSGGEEKDPGPITVKELMEQDLSQTFTINGSKVLVPPLLLINALPAGPEACVAPGDRVEIRPPATVGELARLMDVDLSSVDIFVGGEIASVETNLAPEVAIRFEAKAEAGLQHPAEGVEITLNGKSLVMSPEHCQLMHVLAQAGIDVPKAGGNLVVNVNGREADLSTMLQSGDRVEVFLTARDRARGLQN